jgi:hypothetical protein
MGLNEYWASLQALEADILDLDILWKQETGAEHSLVYSYKIDEIVKAAKETLVRAAVQQILAKHDIHNVTVPEEVFKKLMQAEGFSTETVEEAITHPYIAEADTEARATHQASPWPSSISGLR